MTPAEELHLVNEFLTLLSGAPSPSELSQVLTLSTFQSYDARSAALVSLNGRGQIQLVGHFNVSDAQLPLLTDISIWDDNPISRCVRNRQVTVISNDEIKNSQLAKNQRHILVPIGVGHAGIGALLVSSCANSPKPIEKFALMIASTLTHYLRAWQFENTPSYSRAGVTQNESAGVALKPRQLDVLRLMHDGLTTQQIAQKLGYSRSTIHQETILIYRLLGVHNKHEALKFAFSAGYL